MKEQLGKVDIEKISGGSLEDLGNMGVRVFDSSTGETIAICKSYGDAVHLAKRHSISGLGTWGDGNESIKKRREREDREHYHSKIAGFED